MFHLGKSRPSEADNKFNLTDADAVYEWIEQEMSKFIAQLPAKGLWRKDRATLESEIQTLGYVKNLPVQTASSADPVVVSRFYDPSTGLED
jgi:hypothetical protein